MATATISPATASAGLGGGGGGGGCGGGGGGSASMGVGVVGGKKQRVGADGQLSRGSPNTKLEIRNSKLEREKRREVWRRQQAEKKRRSQRSMQGKWKKERSA
jgi:hypothetical protein